MCVYFFLFACWRDGVDEVHRAIVLLRPYAAIRFEPVADCRLFFLSLSAPQIAALVTGGWFLDRPANAEVSEVNGRSVPLD